jgi:hypothetical protein
MSELLQFIIVVAFGALCFGCGCLIAFIVTRNKYRDEMIKAVSPATISRPANGNGESSQRNRRRGKCSERGGSPAISPSCRSYYGSRKLESSAAACS